MKKQEFNVLPSLQQLIPSDATAHAVEVAENPAQDQNLAEEDVQDQDLDLAEEEAGALEDHQEDLLVGPQGDVLAGPQEDPEEPQGELQEDPEDPPADHLAEDLSDADYLALIQLD